MYFQKFLLHNEAEDKLYKIIKKQKETSRSDLPIKTDSRRKDRIFDFRKFKMLRFLERYRRWCYYIKQWEGGTSATKHMAEDF